MKIAVIGSTGNLGRRIVRQACERGYGVRAFVRTSARAEGLPAGVEVVERDLFALEPADLNGCDVLLSAFGSGFSADPAVNERACEAYVTLARATGVRVAAIVGSGSLYADETRTAHVYELPGHPSKLVPISAAATRGLAALDAADDVNWRAVTPGLRFDAEGPLSVVDEVRLDTSRVLPGGSAGASYSTYEDVARVMLDTAVDGTHAHELVCVLSPEPAGE